MSNHLGCHAYQSAEFCAQVQRCGGVYVLEASDNQPTLVEAIADPFLRSHP